MNNRDGQREIICFRGEDEEQQVCGAWLRSVGSTSVSDAARHRTLVSHEPSAILVRAKRPINAEITESL